MGKITDYPTDSTPTGDDVVLTVDIATNSSKKATIASLAAPVAANLPNNSVGAAVLATNAITLGQAEITAAVGPLPSSTTDQDITGVAVTVTVPAGGRRLKLTLNGGAYSQTGGIGTVYGVLKIKEGTTVIDSTDVVPGTANLPYGFCLITSFVASAGTHTYKFSVSQNSTGPNFTVGASSTSKTSLLAELI